jgi:hypothetical protein
MTRKFCVTGFFPFYGAENLYQNEYHAYHIVLMDIFTSRPTIKHLVYKNSLKVVL